MVQAAPRPTPSSQPRHFRCPATVRTYYVAVTSLRGDPSIEYVTLDECAATRWRDEFNRISGDTRVQATVCVADSRPVAMAEGVSHE